MSMLTPLTVAVELLSALSTAVPVTDWFAAFAVSVVAALDVLMPDVASLDENETVTSELFQPLEFGAGVREPAIVGAVLSSLTWIDAVAVLPTLSVTRVFLVTVPSVVTESLPGDTLLTPEPPTSLPVQVIDTFDLFQPAPFGAGAATPEAVGAVLSNV